MQIKIRAIVPVNTDGPKKMEYFDLSKQDDLNRLSYADYDASKLMQFTGLKDKNGNEVYTGDIDESGCIIEFDEIQLCYITIWNNYYKKWCKSKNIATCGCTYKKVTMRSKLKIIGNIYQNPDLL